MPGTQPPSTSLWQKPHGCHTFGEAGSAGSLAAHSRVWKPHSPQLSLPIAPAGRARGSFGAGIAARIDGPGLGLRPRPRPPHRWSRRTTRPSLRRRARPRTASTGGRPVSPPTLPSPGCVPDFRKRSWGFPPPPNRRSRTPVLALHPTPVAAPTRRDRRGRPKTSLKTCAVLPGKSESMETKSLFVERRVAAGREENGGVGGVGQRVVDAVRVGPVGLRMRLLRRAKASRHTRARPASRSP